MIDKIRGSDQLKLNCATFSALTQEEVMQVAGGNSAFFFPMIDGIPAVWRLPSNQFSFDASTLMRVLNRA